MAQKDELHELIRGLNGPEKRYFKQEAKKDNGGKAPNYLKFFEAYAKMEVYDEATLRNLPYIKHFAESKKHLFKKVIAYIHNYEKKHSYSFQLKELIAEIRFLRKRQIWKQCWKYIRKGKKLAEELDDQTSLLEIIAEERIIHDHAPDRNSKQALITLNEESNQAIENLQHYNKYAFLSGYLYVISLKGNRLDDETLKKIEEEIPIYLLQKPLENLFGRSMRRYLVANSFWAWLKNDSHTYYEALRLLHYWWKDHEKLAMEHQNLYLSDLSNYVSTIFRRQDWPLMISLLQKIKTIKPNSFYDQQLHFYIYSLYSILYALGSLNLEEASTISIGLKRGIKRFQIEGNRKLMLTINIAQLHFLREEFEDCATELDPLTRGPVFRKENVRRMSHILLMATFFSLNRLNKLNSLYRRTIAVFQKMSISSDSFEYITIESINELSSATPKKKLKLLESFYEYLYQLIKNPDTRSTLGLNIIYSWVQSRITGRKLATVIKETENLYPN